VYQLRYKRFYIREKKKLDIVDQLCYTIIVSWLPVLYHIANVDKTTTYKMNIFVVHPSPKVAARMLCDKHIVKMPLESAQMLCAAYDPMDNPPYKRVHYNHPCTQWARHSLANYKWLIEHANELCAEYTKRYGCDIVQHASESVIKWCDTWKSTLTFKHTELTEHPQCFGDFHDRCFVLDNPVMGYRRYYRTAKKRFAKWSHSERLGYGEPYWFTENVDVMLREGQL